MSVIIGMDPHKRSATIEVVDERGRLKATGRYGTDKAGYADMLAAGRSYADRVWAVEGCNGIGKHIAHRLVHDGETVLDVPAKLSAQVRVFATGNGRKTDPVDAHSVAMVALHSPNLVQVQVDADLQVMGISPTGVTSWAAPEPRPSTGCTGCCWNCYPAGRRSSCPRHRPAR
ncbi:IS110 family transposase [Micromonospora coerulea]|uniref:IS110 family transposase n=1 Tax=Micromonospora coerulea TaxID=47856 RepID=UPI001F2A2993|nr:IS110 family transposase [Micromonospora veneta]